MTAEAPKIARANRLVSRVEKRSSRYYVYHLGILMKTVNQMYTGSSFGDLALLSKRKNEPRLATVLCTKDTHFAVLDRASFDVVEAN